MANAYSKRPLWQWIIIYLIIGAIVYGIVYYFFIANKSGGINYGTSQPTSNTNQGNTTPAAGNSVQISNFSFTPATLTVKVGDTVTWTNEDSTGHSATADDGSLDTGIIAQGKSGSATFNKAGTYTYHCKVHPSMHGTIIVQ